jgi:hypothetical protein
MNDPITVVEVFVEGAPAADQRWAVHRGARRLSPLFTKHEEAVAFRDGVAVAEVWVPIEVVVVDPQSGEVLDAAHLTPRLLGKGDTVTIRLEGVRLPDSSLAIRLRKFG